MRDFQHLSALLSWNGEDTFLQMLSLQEEHVCGMEVRILQCTQGQRWLEPWT